MGKIMRLFPEDKRMVKRKRKGMLSAFKGFSLIEVLLVIALVGMMAFMLMPSISNTLENRDLENKAKEVLLAMQRAKFEAVKTKINHRVRFQQFGGSWTYFIERQTGTATWSRISGFIGNTIPSKFNVTIGFPDDSVVFSPMGFVENYTTGQDNLSIQNPRLDESHNIRLVTVFAGGAVDYFDPYTSGT
ncbi:MAG: prepilin-type N-terminal cleavage/methylation domain-containing protein [Candidatus Aminicenantes bacterium]|nr:prepilin-type N-terminal cleavage/methylation domain-containing protein [Candidatus Aminicenantes bacterium]